MNEHPQHRENSPETVRSQTDEFSLRLAIVSDLHAYEDDRNQIASPPSRLRVGAAENQPNRHPIAGLLQLIQNESLSTELLVCCGDMADRARPTAIKYVWDVLAKLQTALRAHTLIVTPGNHDVDSRYIYNDDAKGVLQSLEPPFPLAEEIDNDRFWARNFVLLDKALYRLAVINSVAYHGNKEGEFEHGRISANTLSKFQKALSIGTPRALNILVCHHHPFRYPDLSATSPDYSEMKGGDALLELLSSGDFGRWLIIHGHRHEPRISYGPGNSSSPVIFGAGSLSAQLYLELQGRARNQFYIIDLPFTRYDALHLELAGTFRSWDWIDAMGWQPATIGSGLPGAGGFGYRNELTYVARSVADVLGNEPFKSWTAVLATFPQLEYLIPGDVQRLERLLKANHRINVLHSDAGAIHQIGRP